MTAQVDVLHLLDTESDYQTRYLALQAAQAAPRTIGRGGDFRDFWAAAKWLRHTSPPGPVYAWGIKSLIAAAMAGQRPIIHTPPPQINGSYAAGLNWLAHRRDLTVACPTAWLRNNLCRRGLAPDKCVLIRPGILASFALPSRRLGFEPGDFVVLAPGESTRASGHLLSLWTVSILHELDPTWKLLVWGRGKMAEQLNHFAQRLNHPNLLRRAADLEFEPLTTIADAALITATPAAEAVPTAMCMAHGLPIVATPIEPLAERNAVLIGDRSPRALAHALLELRQNPTRMEQLRRAAQADAQHLFEPNQFLQLHSEIHRRAAR